MKNFTKIVAFLFSVLLINPMFGKHKSHQKNYEFFSQASQDEFVYTLLYKLSGKQNKGYYLEIGANHPYKLNNTYFFEKNCHWNGVSIDISDQDAPAWREHRTNKLLIQDAFQVDYAAILSSFPRMIDYLSLDVDGGYDILLQKLPTNYIFKVITIEHDSYRYGDEYKDKEREILTSLGYYLLCPNVFIPGFGEFEDWWIHPSAFSPEALEKLKSLDLKSKVHFDIVPMINAALN